MDTAVIEGETVARAAAKGRVASVEAAVSEPLETRMSSEASASSARSASTRHAWATLPIDKRVAVLRRARFALADMTERLADAIPHDLARTPADTRVAEILPLLAACRFLERKAAHILAKRRLGRRGLPFWLAGTDAEIHRVALGTVLVIGPSNYPLFLPGVQALQALVAGNAVIWKPGRSGRDVAELFAQVVEDAGLPKGLLQVTDDTVQAGEAALRGNISKVIFTGSAENARAVLRIAAERLIPCVIEASGCDAVIVLPSADLDRLVKAVVFGLRLNGSATCMAPRRLILIGQNSDALVSRLVKTLESVPPVTLAPSTWEKVMNLLVDAEASGAKVIGELNGAEMQPILVTNVSPAMKIAQADLFAPVLSILEVRNTDDALAAQDVCPFGLTAAIFGEEREARALAAHLEVGTVLINDIIVSTADPRVPFEGRRQSGFGATRGAEGLLEMTASKVISVRRGNGTRQYDATTIAHEGLFDGVIRTVYGKGLTERWNGLKQMVRSGKNLGKQ